jgi:VanZ family protein
VTLRDFRRPRLWLGVWIFGWLLCIVLSLTSPIQLGGPPDSDKLGHFLAYFTLSAWAILIFRTRRAQILAALSLILLGLAMELAQATLTTTRLGDPRDALANTLGVATGLALAFTPLANLLRRLDHRLFPARP